MIGTAFPAMGTTVEVFAGGPAGVDEVRAWFTEVEACCSRFRPDSDLSRLNDHPGGTVRVSPLLAEVLAVASEIRRRTGGLVDAGVGGRVAAWGYDRTFAEVAGPAEAPARSPDVVWEIEGRSVTRAPGIRLDLGGIAKGWTADRAVERGMASVVSAGGDLRSDDPATVVDVFDGGGGRLAAVALGRGGLATSSISRRRWTAAGREVSHLIDPRTGDPVSSPVVSATVIAATAAEAEAGAKAVLLMGEEGLAWADQCSWVSGALVEWHDGSVFATTDLEAA